MVRDIRAAYAALPVLVLTIHDARGYAEQAFAAGASGYVTKQEMGEVLLVAIRSVLAGERYLSPQAGAGLART